MRIQFNLKQHKHLKCQMKKLQHACYNRLYLTITEHYSPLLCSVDANIVGTYTWCKWAFIVMHCKLIFLFFPRICK